LAIKIETLQYHVHNVLPTVYDESLSFMELLNKVMLKLNETIGEVNVYFGENIEVHVEAIMEEWKTDGTLDAIINDGLDERITANATNITGLETRVTTNEADILALQNNSGVSDLANKHEWILKGRVSILEYGAVDYGTDPLIDNTAIIQEADQFCYDNGLILEFPQGVYRCTNGITRRAEWVGYGVPKLGTFPLEDEKLMLREGSKHKLRGSVLLFTGTGTNTHTTQRTDEFSSFTYCVRTIPKNTTDMKNIGIVMDMNVLDVNGTYTLPSTDARANYDVGYFIDDSPVNRHGNFVVFGYFAKCGTLVMGKETTGYEGDPDYISFSHGSTTGNIGLAILGSQSDDGFDGGLSGSRFLDFNIFAKDHHSRDNTTDDWGKACIYIDGFTTATNSDINGHYFTQCLVRSYCNNPVILDHASNVSFVQTVFETSKRGTPNSTATKFLATVNTGDVHIIGCRFSDGAGLTDPDFSQKMYGKLIVIGEPYDDVNVIKGLGVARLSADTKPFIQLTDDVLSKVQGWTMQLDMSNQNMVFKHDNNIRFLMDSGGGVLNHGYSYGGTKTISGGAITVFDFNFYGIDTEGGATTDDLITINGGTFVGQRLQLRTVLSSRTVNIVEDTVNGNIRVPTSPVVLLNAQDRVELEWDGTNWVLINYQNNG
jgi:hypothetical protein